MGERLAAGKAEKDNSGEGSTRKTYETAVADGFYQPDTKGLHGKYDNVRRYWEDQITRYALREFVEPLARRKRQSLSRIRVVDLGAGSGEGYEVLSGLKKANPELDSREVDVLPPDILGYYKGVDVCSGMVSQGNKTHENDPKVEFVLGDLSKGLQSIKSEPAFDIYFSIYGSLSHLNDDQMAVLLNDICEHFQKQCILVVDLLGRFSFEWPCYWDESQDGEDGMNPYSMSYLYPGEMAQKEDVDRFPLRYWSTREFEALVEDILRSHDVRLVRKKNVDRSILVGRHMNTREFNRHAQPIRAAVNGLHEFNQRIDLSSLIFDYSPHPGYTQINEFFENFQMAWNSVVYATIEALEHWDQPEWLRQAPDGDYPNAVHEAIHTIRNVVGNVKWFRMGDPRANVVEPQLGYVLRNLEMDLQQGIGAAHSLLTIYELEKK